MEINNDAFSKLVIRPAVDSDGPRIWEILQQAIQKRKAEGSDQWQDGYPNPQVIQRDLSSGYGFVVINLESGEIVAYAALIFDGEPAYSELEGTWLDNDIPFGVVHRVAVDQVNYTKGLATWIMEQMEKVCADHKVYSIKVDTNHDNIGMLRIFEKLSYHYCGKVYFRGSARSAFQKIFTEKK